VYSISLHSPKTLKEPEARTRSRPTSCRQLTILPAFQEKQTSIPKVYAFLGLIATYFFFIFFNIGGQLLTNVAGFVIPGYYSLEALFTVGKADDTQWLTVNIAVLLMPCP
jgi:hypothetical protein